MNLESKIQETINNYLASEKIEKQIEKSIDEAVKKAMYNLTGYNGILTNVIERNVKSSLVPMIEKYDYSEFAVKLDTVLTEILKQSTLPTDNILNKFKILNTVIDKKEIDIEDILEEYINCKKDSIDTDDLETDEEGYYYPVECSLTVNDTGYFLNKKSLIFSNGSNEEDIEIPLTKHWKEDDYYIESGLSFDLRNLSCLNDFEVFILNLERSRIKVIGLDKKVIEKEIDVEGNEYH